MLTFKQKKVIIISVFLLTLSTALNLMARNINGFADWYVSSVYNVFVNFMGRICSVFRISVSELLIAVLLIFIAAVSGIYIRRVICSEITVKSFIVSGALGIVFGASILFCVYTVNCGINYHHTDFALAAGLASDEVYSKEELELLCNYFLEQTNELSEAIEKDNNGLCRVSDSMNVEAVAAMTRLGTIYKELSGYYPYPKSVIASKALSYQHLTGIYSPFTIEANYNSEMPDFYKPFTACHELAHLKGFMKEDEANFIAILACLNSDNIEFRYSGSILAYVYCSNALYKQDPQSAALIKKSLSSTARKELANNSKYWNGYKGNISKASAKINDAYLKVNAQAAGIKSYGKVVDLLLSGFYGQKRDEKLYAENE